MYANKYKLQTVIDVLLKHPKIKPLQGISTLKDLDLLSTLLKPHIDQCAPMIKHIYLKNLNDPVMQSMLLTLASCFMDVESLNDFVINIIKYGFSVQAEQQLKKIGFPESSLLSIQKNVIHLNKQFIDFLTGEITQSINTEKELMLNLSSSLKFLLQKKEQVTLIQMMQNNFLNILLNAEEKKSKWTDQLKEGYKELLKATTGEEKLAVISSTLSSIRRKEIIKRSSSAKKLEDLAKWIIQKKEEGINFSQKYYGMNVIQKELIQLEIQLDQINRNIHSIEEKLNKENLVHLEEKEIYPELIAFKPKLTALKAEANHIKDEIDKIKKEIENPESFTTTTESQFISYYSTFQPKHLVAAESELKDHKSGKFKKRG